MLAKLYKEAHTVQRRLTRDHSIMCVGFMAGLPPDARRSRGGSGHSLHAWTKRFQYEPNLRELSGRSQPGKLKVGLFSDNLHPKFCAAPLVVREQSLGFATRKKRVPR